MAVAAYSPRPAQDGPEPLRRDFEIGEQALNNQHMLKTPQPPYTTKQIVGRLRGDPAQKLAVECSLHPDRKHTAPFSPAGGHASNGGFRACVGGREATGMGS